MDISKESLQKEQEALKELFGKNQIILQLMEQIDGSQAQIRQLQEDLAKAHPAPPMPVPPESLHVPADNEAEITS